MQLQMICPPCAIPAEEDPSAPLTSLSPTFQDHFLARLLEGLHSLIVRGLGQVGAVDGEDGVPHVERLSLIRRQPLKDLGDQDGHFILSATLKHKRQGAVVAAGMLAGVGGRGMLWYQMVPARLSLSAGTQCTVPGQPTAHSPRYPQDTCTNHSSQSTVRLYSSKTTQTGHRLFTERTCNLAISPSVLAGKRIFICIINHVS